MKYFKQGSFFYGQRQDGKYTQVATYGGLDIPHLSVVSENTATQTVGFNDYENVEITGRQFKEVFLKSVALIAGFEICSEPEIKSDELNESDVQKEN